ncbi:RNA polymerase sigma factor [Gilvimarinus agarilyticus]|uniref:RNA polymerase sigma factor n=1 Tax=Gilvimarinus sp. 2_MG-2023 TaxID=3062666 RepID=UPI001C08D903|nr:RNA polymerase sigma factor [Gilvimarinus sp. 2_MG-2023]MBU2887537.1 RNA polymerase sigma factor [Gilvimarinus agarilyticus]MDO6572188.1 RNA polymerase sigma factor [Gilvimarinus sp. 2_MG-2023]
MSDAIHHTVQRIYREHSRQVLATLIRLLKDFDLAEEALQEAFACALKQWPDEGVPHNPTAWLVSTGRFKAIDQLRKHRREVDLVSEDTAVCQAPDPDTLHLEDDRLRLIFTCCHPSLSHEAAIALTLREVCDLSTEAIASAFLTKASTTAQRIVRAKRKIQSAGIPYEVPGKQALPERLQGVLKIVYLIFNEGYYASGGDSLQRVHLTDEAIRLGRLLTRLLPQSEVYGLLALMLLQHSRQDTRSKPNGDIILLEDQDRTRWHHDAIAEATALLPRALVGPATGSYALQAAIAALHAEAPTAADTDWQEIWGLYQALYLRTPTPVVALNQAVAQAMAGDIDTAISHIEQLANGDLASYFPAHAAWADLLRRSGRHHQAHERYHYALSLTRLAAERRYLQMRIEQYEKNIGSAVD